MEILPPSDISQEVNELWQPNILFMHHFPVNLLSVGDDDDQYGGNAADYDDHCQSQERPLSVAYSLHGFLHAGHHLRGPDLQNSSTGWEKRLELFVDVQEFAVKEPKKEKLAWLKASRGL